MAFKDYSVTPASNTVLSDGTYVGPNMLRNKVRPALQQIMADGKGLALDLDLKLIANSVALTAAQNVSASYATTAEVNAAAAAASAAEAAASAATVQGQGTLTAIENAIAGLPAGVLPVVLENRTLMAAQASPPLLSAHMLVEKGKEGFFTVEAASNYTAVIAADVNGNVVKQSGTDATKAYVRGFDSEGTLTPQMFYETTDPDWTNAFERMIAVGAALAKSAANGIYDKAAPRMFIPPLDNAKYLLSRTLHLQDAHFTIEGLHKGRDTTGGSVLKWTVDTTGIIVHNARSSGVDGVIAAGDPDRYSAGNSIIRGILLEGTQTTLGQSHGLVLRTRAQLENVGASNFSANGFHFVANEGIANPPYGNLNHTHGHKLNSLGNGWNGLYVAGDNANNMEFINGDHEANGRWGVLDETTVGNYYEGGHTSQNGKVKTVGTTTTASIVYNTSFYWAAMYGATSAQLAANAPGTNSAIWRKNSGTVSGASADWPQWAATGTNYNPGGAACLATHGYWASPYNEGGPHYIGLAAKSDYGFPGPNVVRNAGGQVSYGIASREINTAPIVVSIQDVDTERTIEYALGNNAIGDNRITSLIDSADSGTEWFERLVGGVRSMVRGTFRAWQILTDGAFHPTLLRVGAESGNTHRLVKGDSVQPTAGSGAEGDWQFNHSPGTNGPIGWHRQTTGTGVWEPKYGLKAPLAALPADATDLATAITLVNAMKARLKVTGGHGLVAD